MPENGGNGDRPMTANQLMGERLRDRRVHFKYASRETALGSIDPRKLLAEFETNTDGNGNGNGNGKATNGHVDNVEHVAGPDQAGASGDLE
jgi:hypothetical protein